MAFTLPVTVGDLTRYLTDLFASDELLSNLWVEGEVVESVVTRAGHCFFRLADDEAALRCVLFRGSVVRQSALPIVGQRCAVHGYLSLYAREGQYQLYADLIRPAGVGLAALELELLRQQLEAEGLFDPTRKRPLPERIATIGLVTSADGAVRHDLDTVVRRRNPFVHVILSPAAVQGDQAPESLVWALGALIADGRSDVIVIGRGGGSASDLAAFNSERLVRAVFASPIPVVSAVGHETDWTLLDLVADVRAATPTAAAELCTDAVRLRLDAAQSLVARSHALFRRSISERVIRTATLQQRVVRASASGFLADQLESLAALRRQLEGSAHQQVLDRRSALTMLSTSANRAINASLSESRQRIRFTEEVLNILNPSATLDRGYAVLSDPQSRLPITSTTQLRSGGTIVATLRDGSIEATVSKTG